MCGFVGVVDYSSNLGDNHSYLKEALSDLQRRGPDQQSIWKNDQGDIQFGFARLAIRDLTDAGKQPMVSSDDQLIMMYNGETYNTQHLLQWAEISESSLNGHADSEVILECMVRKGIIETICQMDGIFAIALLDLKTRQLYLIRDHAGVKPLYAGFDEKGIVFSSHYHHIINHPLFSEQLVNPNALTNYFQYGFIQAGEGLFENTYFLPHSHATIFDLRTKSWKYQHYEPNTRLQEKTLKELYEYAVNSQLVSDVPIGTFLSGGVDSTLTTAIASKAIPGIRAYTIGVNDNRLNEAPEAARFASYFDVKHSIEYISEKEVQEAIQQYDDALAEPLGDFSSLITLKVCQAAKKDLTVVLSGDGGDELFFGYSRFQNAKRYYTYLSQPLHTRLFMIILSRIRGKKVPFRLLKFSGFLDYYLSVQGQTGNKEWLTKILKNPRKKEMPFVTSRYNQPLNEKEALRLARQIEYDIHMQKVLLKVDRASMYHSLEVRTPMLSIEFREKAFQLDFENCCSENKGKQPLRNLLKTFLPLGAPESGSKKGFEPPMRKWLQTSLREKVYSEISQIPELLIPYINKKGINRLWNEHQNNLADHSWPLWTLYSLLIWLKKRTAL